MNTLALAILALQAAGTSPASLAIAIAKNPSCLRVFVSNESRDTIRCDYLQVGRTLFIPLFKNESGQRPDPVSSRGFEIGQEAIRKDGKDPYPPSNLAPGSSLYYDWSPPETHKMIDGIYRVQFEYRPRSTKFTYRGVIKQNLSSPVYEARWSGGKYESLRVTD